jgi:hypothetical protein
MGLVDVLGFFFGLLVQVSCEVFELKPGPVVEVSLKP